MKATDNEGSPTAATAIDERRKPQTAADWQLRLREAGRTFEKWEKQCDHIDDVMAKRDRADEADREYSMFWANMQVLEPAVYARPPLPAVSPRFEDSGLVPREASELLERCIVTTFAQARVDELMREVRGEFLRYNRGQAWVRVEDVRDAEGLFKVVFQWVPFRDFRHDPAIAWSEVTWVARRSWVTREDGIERFGDAFVYVPMKKRDGPDDDQDEKHREQKAPVWEIWCKRTRTVYWIAEDHAEILDQQPFMFDLEGDWPCPMPCYGTRRPRSLVPVPDLVQYKDQIEEINHYTARIAALSQSLRLRGFYAAGSGDIESAVEAAMKSTDDRQVLIPVSSFGALGGTNLRESVVWLPLEQVAVAIRTLVEIRRVLIDDVYQITGIADIVRGQSKASETLGAQQIKSQWASLRINDKQAEIQRFARDLARIAGEIMAENFSHEQLMAMSQAQLPSRQEKQMLELAQQYGVQLDRQQVSRMRKPAAEDVTEFLRQDHARGFNIEIETDSTIQPDEDGEKQRRIEFVQVVGGMFQQVAPLVMQAPQLGPFVMEVLKFAAGAFRAGRPLYGTLEELSEMLEMAAEQPPPQQQQGPDPAQVMALEGVKARTEADVTRSQAAIARTQMDMQRAQAQHGIKMQELAANAALNGGGRRNAN